MEEVKKAIWNDYRKVSDLIECTKFDETGYREKLGEEQDKIRNELIKVAQIESDNSGKLLQNKFDAKRDIIRNSITIVTFTVSTIVSLYLAHKTFDFDKTATVTSTLGRNILNNAVPKMFKK